MKLNYNYKRTITTADLFDACDPPLVFEVKSKPGKKWAKLDREFDESGNKDVGIAKQLIAKAFLTVSDSENTYPIKTISQIESFQAAIQQAMPADDPDPETSEDFLCAIAWGFSVNHYDFLVKNLGNSRRPLKQSNINGQNRSKVKVS